MITRIEVDGFKSLSNFELQLNQGLNILVGPNGSGKTNIILFFEFLSKLSQEQIGNAVSQIGGAGSIFKKIGFDEYEKEIQFKIYGCKKIATRKYLNYEYAAIITNSFEQDNIFYSSQSIRVSNSTVFKDPDSSKRKVNWDVDISIGENDSKSEISVNEKKYRGRLISKSSKSKLDEVVRNILKKNTSTHNTIITSLFPLLEENAFLILSDLRGGETFNVVPSKVKEQEDAANPPGIRKDGSGLATTLYAMKKGKSKDSNLLFPYYFFTNKIQENKYKQETLDKIIDYLKLANNTISNLDVINDPFDNRLIVKINIETANYKAILPLSSMSDGTIKWLSLITAILTSNSIFSIEEPENFLHPWMQAEIVNIMRNQIESKNEESFVIMTTHSESLINYSEPNELILVGFKNGKTTANRIDNLEIIKNEISNSGLGLGHFYFSNSLSDE